MKLGRVTAVIFSNINTNCLWLGHLSVLVEFQAHSNWRHLIYTPNHFSFLPPLSSSSSVWYGLRLLTQTKVFCPSAVTLKASHRCSEGIFTSRHKRRISRSSKRAMLSGLALTVTCSHVSLETERGFVFVFIKSEYLLSYFCPFARLHNSVASLWGSELCGQPSWGASERQIFKYFTLHVVPLCPAPGFTTPHTVWLNYTLLVLLSIELARHGLPEHYGWMFFPGQTY